MSSRVQESNVGGQFEIGRIARIPILIDFSFILLIVIRAIRPISN